MDVTATHTDFRECKERLHFVEFLGKHLAVRITGLCWSRSRLRDLHVFGFGIYGCVA